MDEQQNVPVSQDQPIAPEVTVQPKQPIWKSKLALTVAVFLIVAAVGAFAAYQVYASPGRVWERFVKSYKSTSQLAVLQKFSVSYQDNGSLSKEATAENPFAQMFEKIKLGLKGDAYIKLGETNKTDMDGDITYEFASGGSTISANIKLIMKQGVIYAKFGDIPFFGSVFSSLNEGNKVEWVKIDPESMQNFAKEQNANMPNYDEQLQKYQAIFEKYADKIVLLDKSLGKEKVGSVNTVHFKNKLDTTQLKSFLMEMINYVFEIQSVQMSEVEVKKAKEMVEIFVNEMVGRLEVKEFETWVGVTDGRLYKLKFTSNAPSLVGLMSTGLELDKDESLKADDKKFLQELLKKASFDGEIMFMQENSDFGKVREVNAPENSFDMYKKLKEEEQKQKDMMMEFENFDSVNMEGVN
jgi:hypothetical protein